MRLRSDSGHIAGWKRAHELRGCTCSPRVRRGWRDPDGSNHVAHLRAYRAIPKAELGDAWTLRNKNGGITGYALTCPKADCEAGVHFWDHARDCPQRYAPDAASCWTWTGSIEDGTLTANPSLHCVAEWGGCGWHGWLKNGKMVPA